MTQRSRLALTVTTLLSAGALLVPAPAQAATTLGQTVTPSAGSTCTGLPDFEVVQQSRGGVSSAAPTAGVITSWSFLAGTTPSNIELRVFHRNPNLDLWAPVTPSGTLLVVPANSGTHTYAARVPIAAGDFVGLHTTGGSCYANTPSGDHTRYYYNTEPLPVGSAQSFSDISAIVDLSAVVEPDVDHDGYGDETQDACPQLGGVLVPCLPHTTITKNPKRHSHGPSSKLRFTSSIPGSAFSCTLDKRRARSCASPEKYRCLKPGKHTFSVVAVSTYGLVDPSPAKTHFRVSSARRGC